MEYLTCMDVVVIQISTAASLNCPRTTIVCASETALHCISVTYWHHQRNSRQLTATAMQAAPRQTLYSLHVPNSNGQLECILISDLLTSLYLCIHCMQWCFGQAIHFLLQCASLATRRSVLQCITSLISIEDHKQLPNCYFYLTAYMLCLYSSN